MSSTIFENVLDGITEETALKRIDIRPTMLCG